MTTNLVKSIGHGAVSVVLFGIPLLLASHGAWLDLTAGGVLMALYNFLLAHYF